MIQYPITVTGIKFDGEAAPISPKVLFGPKAGAWVAVRPCDHEKTYLGVLLGEYERTMVSFNKETGELAVGRGMGNPAMWVPDLARVVMGWESWWSAIKIESDLRQITDADIEDVWYVKALKSLAGEKSDSTESDTAAAV